MNEQFDTTSQNGSGSPVVIPPTSRFDSRVFSFVDNGEKAIAQAGKFVEDALAKSDERTQIMVIGIFKEKFTRRFMNFEAEQDFDPAGKFRQFAEDVSAANSKNGFNSRVRFSTFSDFGDNEPVSASFTRVFEFIHQTQNGNNFSFEVPPGVTPFQANFGFPFSIDSFIFCFTTPAFS